MNRDKFIDIKLNKNNRISIILPEIKRICARVVKNYFDFFDNPEIYWGFDTKIAKIANLQVKLINIDWQMKDSYLRIEYEVKFMIDYFGIDRKEYHFTFNNTFAIKVLLKHNFNNIMIKLINQSFRYNYFPINDQSVLVKLGFKGSAFLYKREIICLVTAG